MGRQYLAGTGRRALTHCHTICALTPIAEASAAWVPQPETAFSMGFVLMGTQDSIAIESMQELCSATAVSRINSIASMKKKKKQRSQESVALEAAFAQSGLSQAAVASHMGVTPAAARQWIKGDRPVPAVKAARLGALLGIQPQMICANYAAITESAGNVVPLRELAAEDQRRPELALRRVENDVDALRYALASIVVTTVTHRPAEALAVAASIRKSVPKKYQERGFVRELLVTLDAAARA